jgi:membrane associated rhomboid family serine protease
MVVFGLEVALSLVWLMSEPPVREQIADYTVANARHVFHEGKVWTLVTSPFLQANFLGLLLHGVVMFMFVPTLERFWGTPRFLRFVAITAIAGTLAGSAMGLATGRIDQSIIGLDVFTTAAIVAFGIVYARQQVQFFAVLPLTGRQLMYGYTAVMALFVLFGARWEIGVAYAAAMSAAAIMTSKKLSPGLAWRRWQIKRARAKLSVIEGGQPSKKKRDEHKYLN